MAFCAGISETRSGDKDENHTLKSGVLAQAALNLLNK
jgi:hypothetical protein